MFKALTSSFAVAAAIGLSLVSVDASAQATNNTAQATSNDYVNRNAAGDLVVRDDAAGFGRERQWAFSSDAALSIQRQTQSDTDGSVTTVTLAPAVDYFVIKNLSVGGTIGIEYRKAGDISGTRFTLGPRVGYNFEVSRMLSIWPKLGFSYAHTNQDFRRGAIINGNSTTIGASDANNAIALNIFVPVMLHPAPHFFAGFGPFLDTDLSGDNRATVWGLKLTMGGWVNSKEG